MFGLKKHTLQHEKYEVFTLGGTEGQRDGHAHCNTPLALGRASGAADASWVHNREVVGSNPIIAKLVTTLS